MMTSTFKKVMDDEDDDNIVMSTTVPNKQSQALKGGKR